MDQRERKIQYVIGVYIGSVRVLELSLWCVLYVPIRFTTAHQSESGQAQTDMELLQAVSSTPGRLLVQIGDY